MVTHCREGQFSRVLFSSRTDDWSTPEDLYKSLNEEFAFTFDPCPLGAVVDGGDPLFTKWAGERVFCNPPYSNIYRFLRRAKEADVAVFLIPSRTDTRWFHSIVLPQAKEIRFDLAELLTCISYCIKI